MFLFKRTFLLLFFSEGGDPLELLQVVIPDLQDLTTWMANALEVLHCVHQLLRQRGADVGMLSNGPPSSLPASGSEAIESMSLLQEVIVYSFQQALYPATKVCYIVTLMLLISHTSKC